VKKHPTVSPTVFNFSYPCITTLCCVTEIVYAINKGLVKLLNVFLIIFFLFRDSLLMQPIFAPNLYHDSHSLLSSHKLLQMRIANSKCITACSCFALYNFFYVSTWQTFQILSSLSVLPWQCQLIGMTHNRNKWLAIFWCQATATSLYKHRPLPFHWH